jgi:heat shock protein HslJ
MTKYLLLPFLFVILACNSLKKSSPKETLLGKTFIMKSYNGIAHCADSFPNGMPTMQFMLDGSLSGKTGCNAYFGTFTVQKDSLELKISGMTKMYCMEVDEQGFLDVVAKVQRYKLDQQTLSLFTNGKEVMVLDVLNNDVRPK